MWLEKLYLILFEIIMRVLLCLCSVCVVLLQLAMPGTGEVSLGGPDEQLNVTNNLRVIPGDVGDVRLGVTYPFDTPVYWQLPKQFLGDRVRICMHFQLYDCGNLETLINKIKLYIKHEYTYLSCPRHKSMK